MILYFLPLVETIEDNAELTENLATKDMPTTEYITLGIGGGYCNWCLARVTLVFAFDFFPQNFGRWWEPMKCNFAQNGMQLQWC